ncbi:MAG TPA: alpha/beta fold hydrolase [Chloroflexota bacterium]|nr:alpha/beta fold hydrolase [Chloroflexota bacterium]
MPEPRPLAEVRQEMLERARFHRNPCLYVREDEVAAALTRLDSLDRDAWAEAFSAFAPRYEERAREAEARADAQAARENYLLAYDYYHVARYPAPNSPGKLRAYRKCQENFLKAARYLDPPLERVEMPFQGRPGEGHVNVGYLRTPKGIERAPVVVIWGGIDGFKEERRSDTYLALGLATLLVDMPGVGDAPLAGSEDAERMWDSIFDWIGTRPDLDADRIAVVGQSTGGYWAAKLAHTHRERLRAAVDHGGCTHYAFAPDWIAKAQYGEYPFELAETLACAFGRETYDEWVAYAPRLSLLDQGILDQPCAPLLLVNGVRDSIFPIQDMYLLLEHGSPKAARFYPGGHMGGSPEAEPTIAGWLQRALSR